MKSKYHIEAYSQMAVDECEGDVRWITGCSAEDEADNLKDAKKRMKYLLSEDYRRSGEMSDRLAYAQIRDMGDECVEDMWSETAILPGSDADTRSPQSSADPEREIFNTP